MATEAGWEPRVRTLRAPGGPQEPTRPRGYFPRASGGARPCRQLALRLAASRTWREQISVILGPSVCGNLLQWPRDSNTNPEVPRPREGRHPPPRGTPNPLSMGTGCRMNVHPRFRKTERSISGAPEVMEEGEAAVCEASPGGLWREVTATRAPSSRVSGSQVGVIPDLRASLGGPVCERPPRQPPCVNI